MYKCVEVKKSSSYFKDKKNRFGWIYNIYTFFDYKQRRVSCNLIFSKAGMRETLRDDEIDWIWKRHIFNIWLTFFLSSLNTW